MRTQRQRRFVAADDDAAYVVGPGLRHERVGGRAVHRHDLAGHVGERPHQVGELAAYLLAHVGRLNESRLPLEHVTVERRREEPGAQQPDAAAEALGLLERPLRHVRGARGVLHPHDDHVTALVGLAPGVGHRHDRCVRTGGHAIGDRQRR